MSTPAAPPTQDPAEKHGWRDNVHGAGLVRSAFVWPATESQLAEARFSSERAGKQTGMTAHESSLTAHDERMLVWVLSAYTVTATFWLLFATAVGVLMAYKFGAPDFAPGEWLTFGRLRPIHTNATFYGWASLALVGLAYYVAARSSGTRLYSIKLAWIGLILFNVAAVAGT